MYHKTVVIFNAITKRLIQVVNRTLDFDCQFLITEPEFKCFTFDSQFKLISTLYNATARYVRDF